MTPSKYVHHTELGPSAPNSPLAVEYETYKRILPDLLAAGREGEHILMKGTEVIGFFPTRREAMDAGYDRFLGQSFMVHQILEWEPVYNFGWLTFGKLDLNGVPPCRG